MRCCVNGCQSYKLGHKSRMEISYYLLPRNPELKKKWFQAINRLDWNSEKSSIICSRHIDTKDLKSYKHCKSRVCLREGALPKITKKSQEVVKPMNNELGRPSTRCPISPKKKKMEDDNSMENNMHPNVKIIGNDYHIQWKPKSQKKVEPLNNEMGRSSTQCPIRQKKRKEKEITITENNVHPNVKIVGDYYHIECDPKSSNDSMKIDKELRKYSMDRRRLQVKLTRLPMHLFKNGKMTTKLSVTDIEELEALGLHTELNIKLDPEERLKEEPPDYTTDYDNVVDHDSVCTSVLNIKLETEEELIKTEEKLNKTVDKLNETEEMLHETEELDKTENKLDETEEMWHETEKLNKTENKLDQTEKLNKTEFKLDETEKLNKTEDKLNETEEMWNETEKLNETEEMWNETEKFNETVDKLNETEEELSETEEILNETENFKEQPLDYSGSDDDVDDDDDTSPFYETILIATSEAHDSPETDVEDTDLTRTAKDIKTDDDNFPNIKKGIKTRCRFDDDHENTDMCDKNTDGPPKEPRNELLDGENDTLKRKIANDINYSKTSSGEYSCSKCEYVTYKAMVLNRHLKAHSADTHFICDICSFIAVRKSLLINHIKTHIKRYECKTCLEKFTFRSALKVHVRTHTGEKQYPCKMCGKVFSRVDNLKRHLISIHNFEKPKKKSLIENSTHTREQYPCHMCDKKFSRDFSLKKHLISIHNFEKPKKKSLIKKGTQTGQQYPCKMCDKKFSRDFSLQRHLISIHNFEKPQKKLLIKNCYPCEVCNHKFEKCNTLNDNYKEDHSHDKPYACKICDKMFSSTSVLNWHVKTIHKNDPEKCYVCKMCYGKFAIIQL